MTTCKCLRLADALKLTLGGHEMPNCPEHDPEPTPSRTPPLALNDDDGLRSAINAALGVPATKTIEL